MLLLTEEEATAGMRRVATSGLVDAVLVLDVAPDDERVGLARRLDVPSVFIGVPNDHDGLVCVDLDFEAAAALAVDRLADAGHRSLGLIGHPASAYHAVELPAAGPRRVRAAGRPNAWLAVRGRASRVRWRARRARCARPSERSSTAGSPRSCCTATRPRTWPCSTSSPLAASRVPGDVAVVSVGATFDTTSFQPPLDVIPLVPQASCDLAVDLAMQSMTEAPPAPGVHLIAPEYHAHGSVVPLPPD